ncbi:MAG: helix-turn-helix transcriptional regulator [Bacteroidales bacterium]|nr:helix-turn-helix transcriptional regulator [Bacteroidales bacterium]
MHKRFFEYLTAKGLTAQKISELSCVSKSTVSRFCAGRAIGSDNLLRILQVCDDLSLEWFFYGTGQMLRGRDGITMNMGQYAGAEVASENGVIVKDSTNVKVRTSYDLHELLAEKDRIIMKKDSLIMELQSRIFGGR